METQEKDGEEPLALQQRANTEYLADNTLPEDEKIARAIILSSPQYTCTLIDGILYFSDKMDRLYLIPPSADYLTKPIREVLEVTYEIIKSMVSSHATIGGPKCILR